MSEKSYDPSRAERCTGGEKNIMKKALLLFIFVSAVSTASLYYILYNRIVEAQERISQLESEANSLRLRLCKREEWKETP